MKKAMIALVMLVCMAFTADAMYYQLKYRGSVAGHVIEMALNYNTGDAATGGRPYWTDNGAYRYIDQRGKLVLKPITDANKSTWIFNEYSKGQCTGQWVLKRSKNGLKGTLTIVKTGKVYQVNLIGICESNDWEWAW